MCSWAARTRGSAISPTDLECPDGSSPTVRAPPPPLPSRSCQGSSPADAPRSERLQSEGTDDALRRTWSALRSVLVVVCLVPNLIETAVHPHHPVSRRGALQPRQGASTAFPHSEIFGNVVFWVVEKRPSEARRARLHVKAVERFTMGTIEYYIHVITFLNHRPREAFLAPSTNLGSPLYDGCTFPGPQIQDPGFGCVAQRGARDNVLGFSLLASQQVLFRQVAGRTPWTPTHLKYETRHARSLHTLSTNTPHT